LVEGANVRVTPGHPCRAEIEGMELQVGGPPLVAQVGADRWTGEDGSNGLTFKRNDVAQARLYADQLFDADGTPLVRVLQNGDIADRVGRIVRHARASGDAVVVEGKRVTNTTNLALAAFLVAPEAAPALRGLVACQYLLR
jgi:hypothetical protein